MPKKIAIIIRDRQHEALRMAVGATLSNDTVSVFIMDEKIDDEYDTEVNLEMLSDLKVSIFSNMPDPRFEQKSTSEMAEMLAGYDIIIPY